MVERNAAPAGLPERRVLTVARTMAEKGALCELCTHPWGRHVVGDGCVAGHVTEGTCGCQGLPKRRLPVVPPPPLAVVE